MIITLCQVKLDMQKSQKKTLCKRERTTFFRPVCLLYWRVLILNLLIPNNLGSALNLIPECNILAIHRFHTQWMLAKLLHQKYYQ